MIKGLLQLCIGIVAAFFALIARADSAEDLLKLQIIAHQLETSVSYYSLQKGDSRAEQRLDRVLADGDALAATMTESYPQIAALWHTASVFTLERKTSAASGEDVLFPRHFDQVKLPLYQALDDQVAATDFSALPADRLLTYQALNSLETITGSYMFINISFFGGLSVADIGIKQENERLKDLLTQLQAKQAAQKWHYLEKTILAYNERSAVFIVIKTTDKIRQLLQSRL